MKEEFENIDRFFSNQLTDYSEKPDSGVWDRISRRIGKRDKRNYVIFISRIAAGITVLIGVSIGINFLNRNHLNTSDVIQKGIITDNPETYQNSGRVSSKNTMDKTKNENSNSLSDLIQDHKTINQETVYQNFNSDSEFKEKTVRFRINPGMQRLQSIIPKIVKNESENDLKRNFPQRNEREEPMLITDNQLALIDLYESEENDKNEKIDRWLLGGQFGPLYSGKEITSSGSSASNNNDFEEKGLVTYAGGLNLSYSANKRLSVQSGVYYSKYGSENSDVDVLSFAPTNYAANNQYWTPDRLNSVITGEYLISVSNSTGVIESNADPTEYHNITNSKANATTIQVDELPASISQYLDYIEIPLNIKYKLIDKKFDLSILTGITTNFLVDNGTYFNSGKEKKYYAKTEDLNSINYNGLIGFGIEAFVFKDLIFNFEPKFRYSINSIYKDSQDNYNVHPYSIGIYSGFTYIF